MQKSLSLAAVFVAFSLMGACGGGSDSNSSLGNAQTWCPIAEDWIVASENLASAMRRDARASEIEDAEEARRAPQDELESIGYLTNYDYVSGNALEELRSAGFHLTNNADPDDPGYEEAKENFEAAKRFVERLCAS